LPARMVPFMLAPYGRSRLDGDIRKKNYTSPAPLMSSVAISLCAFKRCPLPSRAAFVVRQSELHELALVRFGSRLHRRNFLSLACDASITCHYFAYSDQDDVWEPDKLSHAVAVRSPGTVLLTNASYRRRWSPLRLLSSVPSQAERCRRQHLVFNKAARRLLAGCGSDVQVPSHELVDLSTGLPQPARAFTERCRLQNRLGQARPQAANARGFIGRLIGFLTAGVYRQTLLGNLGLILAYGQKRPDVSDN
jgi:hypothetical protein